jgi:hypothetical protein
MTGPVLQPPTPAPAPGGPTLETPTAAPASASRRFGPGLIVPAATLAALVLFGAGWLSGSAYTDGPATATSATAPPAAAAVAADPYVPPLDVPEPTETETSGPILTTSNITLSLKTTDKQCFGSAGCNVSVKVEMGYDGAPLSEDETWEVTYSLTGDESGPIIGSFEVTGTQYNEQEESLTTKSSKTKVAVKVTGVEKIG